MPLGWSKVIKEGRKLMDGTLPGGPNGNALAPRLSAACPSSLLVEWRGIVCLVSGGGVRGSVSSVILCNGAVHVSDL